MLMKKIKKDILNGKIPEQLILLMLPSFLYYGIQLIYGIVDSIILGRYIGSEAMAGVNGSATALINFVVNFLANMTSGVSVNVALQHGRGNREAVKENIRTGIFLLTIISLVVTLLGIFTSSWMLRITSVPADAFDYSLKYLKIYCLSLVPQTVYYVGLNVLRAFGDSKRPLYFVVLTCVSKVLFDLLLIIVFDLGVVGSAIATLLSFVLCCAAVLLIFQFTSDDYHFTIKDFGFDMPTLRSILKIGIPIGMQGGLFSGANLFIQSRINMLGTQTVAAYVAYSNVDNIFWNLDSAMSNAIMTVAGQNYGKGQIKRVRQTVLHSTIIEALGAFIIGGSVYYFARPLISIFTTDPEVIELGITMIRTVSIYYGFFAIVQAVSSTSKGCGYAIPPMIISATGICITRIGYLLLYPTQNCHDVLMAFPISWIVTAVMYIVYYLLNKNFKVDKSSSQK